MKTITEVQLKVLIDIARKIKYPMVTYDKDMAKMQESIIDSMKTEGIALDGIITDIMNSKQ